MSRRNQSSAHCYLRQGLLFSVSHQGQGRSPAASTLFRPLPKCHNVESGVRVRNSRADLPDSVQRPQWKKDIIFKPSFMEKGNRRQRGKVSYETVQGCLRSSWDPVEGTGAPQPVSSRCELGLRSAYVSAEMSNSMTDRYLGPNGHPDLQWQVLL